MKNLKCRFRKFGYHEIVTRDKTNLDIFWLKDKSLADLDNLPDPDILANEILEYGGFTGKFQGDYGYNQWKRGRKLK